MKIISLIFCSIKNVPHICNMINANVHGEHAQGETNASGETGAQLRMRMGANERAFQSRWKRNFGYAFNARRICTPDEVSQVEALYSGNIVRPLRERAANEACDNDKVENPSPNVGAGFLETEISVVEPQENQAHPAFLWVTLALSMAVSVPNMFGIMSVVKENFWLAVMATAAFTIAPFALIMAKVSRGWYLVIYAIISIEIFCNCAGFYGGLTGLEHSLYVAPTKFLHMVTTMTNSANEPTALLLSLFFSVGIAMLAIAPVENLKNRIK